MNFKVTVTAVVTSVVFVGLYVLPVLHKKSPPGMSSETFGVRV